MTCMISSVLVVYLVLSVLSTMDNLILNWPKLLRPFKTVFFSPYIDVYVFAM